MLKHGVFGIAGELNWLWRRAWRLCRLSRDICPAKKENLNANKPDERLLSGGVPSDLNELDRTVGDPSQFPELEPAQFCSISLLPQQLPESLPLYKRPASRCRRG
jgi:hypothetical protein